MKGSRTRLRKVLPEREREEAAVPEAIERLIQVCRRTSHVARCVPTRVEKHSVYLSLGQVPDATPAGTPPEAAPRSDRWVTPDVELVPTSLAEVLGDQPAPAISDIHPVAGTDAGPVIDGQLRAPWRWERLLVEAAVIGGL
jgi:hypothetical protein